MNVLPPIFFEKIHFYNNVFFTLLVSCEKRPIMQDEKKGRASMFFVTSMKLSFVKIELAPQVSKRRVKSERLLRLEHNNVVCFCFDDAVLELFVFEVPLFMKHVV